MFWSTRVWKVLELRRLRRAGWGGTGEGGRNQVGSDEGQDVLRLCQDTWVMAEGGREGRERAIAGDPEPPRA